MASTRNWRWDRERKELLEILSKALACSPALMSQQTLKHVNTCLSENRPVFVPRMVYSEHKICHLLATLVYDSAETRSGWHQHFKRPLCSLWNSWQPNAESLQHCIEHTAARTDSLPYSVLGQLCPTGIQTKSC